MIGYSGLSAGLSGLSSRFQVMAAGLAPTFG